MPTFTSVATSNYDGVANGAFPSAEFDNLDGVNGQVTVVNPTGTAGAYHSGYLTYSGARRKGTFNADQYAASVVSGLTASNNADAIGVICRASLDVDSARDFYFAYLKDTGTVTLTYGKVVNGTVTNFALNSTVTTWANGDELLLYVIGSKVAVCKNRGADLLSTTDTALTTGNPGILAFQGSDNMRGDNSDFGNASASGSQDLAGSAAGQAAAAAAAAITKAMATASAAQAAATGALGVGHSLGGAAAGQAGASGALLGGATLTSSPLKNNTGTLLAGESGATAYVYQTSGALVLTKTGQTTNGSGVMSFFDAALSQGVTYRVVYVLASGAEGMEKVTTT